jgi:hypothetical protein
MLGILDVDEDCMSNNIYIQTRYEREVHMGNHGGSTGHMHISLQSSHALTAHDA